MRLSRGLIALTILMALIACNSQPISHLDAIQAPANRILAYQTESTERTGTIVLIRDSSQYACFLAVSINGTLAARLDSMETVKLYVEPGEVLLRVGPDPLGKGLCAITLGMSQTDRETIIKAGETRYYRVTDDGNGVVDIMRYDGTAPRLLPKPPKPT